MNIKRLFILYIIAFSPVIFAVEPWMRFTKAERSLLLVGVSHSSVIKDDLQLQSLTKLIANSDQLFLEINSWDSDTIQRGAKEYFIGGDINIENVFNSEAEVVYIQAELRRIASRDIPIEIFRKMNACTMRGAFTMFERTTSSALKSNSNNGDPNPENLEGAAVRIAKSLNKDSISLDSDFSRSVCLKVGTANIRTVILKLIELNKSAGYRALAEERKIQMKDVIERRDAEAALRESQLFFSKDSELLNITDMFLDLRTASMFSVLISEAQKSDFRSAVVMIGAAHLAGENGLEKLLTSAGWQRSDATLK